MIKMFGLTFPRISSEAILIVLCVAVVLGFLVYQMYHRFVAKYYVLYFSEMERMYEQLNIQNFKPTAIYTKEKRFFRTAPAYKSKGRNVTIYLGKQGTGYLFQPYKTAKGKGKILGTLWEGLKVILGEDLVEQFDDKVKELLMTSKVFLTVELEQGLTPEGFTEAISEENIKSSVIKDVSELIFGNIKTMLQEREWLRDVGLIGTGIALKYLAESLGILP